MNLDPTITIVLAVVAVALIGYAVFSIVKRRRSGN
jgi:hypothetical protein